jgi:hypothetical protein
MKKHPSLGSTAPLSLRSKGSVPPMDGTEVGKRKLKKLLPMRLGESVTYPLEHTIVSRSLEKSSAVPLRDLSI